MHICWLFHDELKIHAMTLIRDLPGNVMMWNLCSMTQKMMIRIKIVVILMMTWKVNLMTISFVPRGSDNHPSSSVSPSKFRDSCLRKVLQINWEQMVTRSCRRHKSPISLVKLGREGENGWATYFKSREGYILVLSSGQRGTGKKR